MLTDIFADRYSNTRIWQQFEERDRKFLVQVFKIAEEQLYPYYVNGKVSEPAKAKWELIHARLSTELGLAELYPRFTSGPAKVPLEHSWLERCKKFVWANFTGTVSPDHYMKVRMSFFEIAFRQRGEDVAAENETLGERSTLAKLRRALQPTGGMRVPSTGTNTGATWVDAMNKELNDGYRSAVHELNVRLRQAGYDLHYHNGFIQIASNPIISSEVDSPFWHAVSPGQWKNVEVDILEAIDRRDTGGRDPALYAAKALESAIKIISGELSLTHGGEKGAHNYIENLASKRAGYFIDRWEAESLKGFFSSVRNPLGHGPGDEKMPELSAQQTNWAIGFCMIWSKSLIERM